MAKKITNYKRLDLKHPVRVFVGRMKTNSVESTGNIRLIRVTDEGRDDVAIDGDGIPRGTVIPWSNVAGALQAETA